MEKRAVLVGLWVCVNVTWAASGGWEEEEEWRLVYKACGAAAETVTEGVVEERVMMMDRVKNGYYRYRYSRYRGNWDSSAEEMIFLMGVCEDDLDDCQCLQCFNHAILHCPLSLSAQIRLNHCFLAYSFPPTPRSGPLSNNSNTVRIAAIAVAAAVAIVLALLFFCFLTSQYSKRHYYS